MHVVLEVISGTDAGRKTLLRTGQKLRVGRTQRADLAVEHDGQLSSMHFILESDETRCTIEDLGSTNGTLLNGSPLAAKATLNDGDEILAGETRFRVRIDGAAGESSAPAPIRDTTEQAASAVETSIVRGPMPCTSEVCDSGLTRYDGSVDDAPPAQLAARLAAAAPLHLIVDFSRAELSLPEGATEPDFLMDWLPEESRTKHSPVVLSPCDGPDLCPLLGEAWGKDAAVGVYSQLPKAGLLKQLRQAAGVFVRPSILAPQLIVGAATFIGHLLRDVEALLVEGESADRWSLFVTGDHTGVLEALGLPQQVSPEQ